MAGLAEAVSQARQGRHEGVTAMRHFIISNYPNTVKALRAIDYDNTTPKRRKGFNLTKVQSKKHDFLYYVRYSHNGKMLPSKWNTQTNDRQAAELFARKNKKRLTERYLQARDSRIYARLESFFINRDNAQNSSLSERCRKEYHSVILKKFIPFLKGQKITAFEQITTQALNNFQDYLLSLGIRPQTANNSVKPVRRVFENLARKGVIQDNPAGRLKGLPVRRNDRKARGCYELGELKGAFNKRWKEEAPLILSLLIYTTGMRNSEIKRMRLDDIAGIDGCRFIKIDKSKTPSGERLVPLHDFAYRKLKAWASKNRKEKSALLFDFKGAAPFTHANTCLGQQLGVSEDYLETENITFYSGRHYWKTLMNAEGLGEDIEEIFMGHKASGNVAKLYNHLDKRGKKFLVKKAKQVFSILDRCIFKTKP